MKICSRCKIEKEESEYYKYDDSNRLYHHFSDGFTAACKDCLNTSQAQKRAQRENEARELLLSYEQYMELRKLASTKSGRAKLRQKNLTLAYRILAFIDKHP